MHMSPSIISRLLLAPILLLCACTTGHEEIPQPSPSPEPTLAAVPSDALLGSADLTDPGWQTPKPQPDISEPCGTRKRRPAPTGARTTTGSSTYNQQPTAGRWVSQLAQIFPTTASAANAVESLETAARTCPAQTTTPASPDPDDAAQQVASYSITTSVSPLRIARWEGFQIRRTKTYQAPSGSSEETTAVLRRANALLVFEYGDLRSPPAPRPDFDTTWHGLADRVLKRLDAGFAPR